MTHHKSISYSSSLIAPLKMFYSTHASLGVGAVWGDLFQGAVLWGTLVFQGGDIVEGGSDQG
jgi:hypothetical protein